MAKNWSVCVCATRECIDFHLVCLHLRVRETRQLVFFLSLYPHRASESRILSDARDEFSCRAHFCVVFTQTPRVGVPEVSMRFCYTPCSIIVYFSRGATARDNYLCSHSGNSRSRLGVWCFPFALDFIISGALENLAVPGCSTRAYVYYTHAV